MPSPLITVISAGGGAGATTLVTLLGACAQEGEPNLIVDFERDPDQSPWVVIVAAEGVEQASRAVWLRENAHANGYRVAAIATRGTEKKRPKAVDARFIPIAGDEIDTTILRIPHWPQAARLPLADLPRWDFARYDKKARNRTGLPKDFATLFTTIVDYIASNEAAQQPLSAEL